MLWSLCSLQKLDFRQLQDPIQLSYASIAGIKDDASYYVISINEVIPTKSWEQQADLKFVVQSGQKNGLFARQSMSILCILTVTIS